MLDLKDFKTSLASYINQIDCEAKLKDAMLYSLISDGKMIRPLLFFTLLQERGIDIKKYYNVGMALEMIHTYSLIHDDLPAMDDDDYRRGKLSSHKKYGEDIAILTGDALLTHSFGVLANMEIDSPKVIKIIKKFVDASGANGGMINGQMLDICAKNPKLEELNLLHHQKTGMMIKLAFEVFLIISNEKNPEKFLKLADNVGLLYQIVDDYLDMYGENIGKNIGSDAANGKVTYVDFYNKLELETKIENLNQQNTIICEELNLSQEFTQLIVQIGRRMK